MAGTQETEALWRALLLGEAPLLRRGRFVLKFLPSDPRCKMCNAPFGGIGAPLMRLVGKGPMKGNPRFCGICGRYMRNHPGGAEIEMSLLFADVRGSTALAERTGPTGFGRLMNRFYDTATRVLIESDALIDKLVGDEVIGLYFPGFAGPRHAREAIRAAQRLLDETGEGRSGDAGLPIGVGIHTGMAYAGVVGSSDTFTDFAVLGDTVNVAARLAALAPAGDVFISEAAYQASGLDLPGLEPRRVELRGRDESINVEIWHSSSANAAGSSPARGFRE